MKAVRPSLSTDEVLWLYTGPGAPSVSDLPAKEAYEVAFCLMGKAVASSNPRMLEEPLRHLQRLDSAARTALPWQPPNSAIAPLAIPVHVNICMQVQRPRWGTHLLSLVCVWRSSGPYTVGLLAACSVLAAAPDTTVSKAFCFPSGRPCLLSMPRRTAALIPCGCPAMRFPVPLPVKQGTPKMIAAREYHVQPG